MTDSEDTSGAAHLNVSTLSESSDKKLHISTKEVITGKFNSLSKNLKDKPDAPRR